jgi:hypothetical protein
MRLKPILAVGIFLAAVLLLRLSFGALAAPAYQVPYTTPTPGPDGRIIYIVQPGDTCTRITMLTGVSLEYLRQTNHLDENCKIMEGQRLVIGIGGPAAASLTPGPSPTPTPVLPTPTPSAGGTAQVCVALYDDLNGDGMRQANTDALGNYLANGTEPIVPGGAISLTSLTGTYSQTLNTAAGLDPVCFKDVPEGKYTVSAAVPDGYNPTTLQSDTVEVKPGDTTQVSFGAQAKVEPVPDQGSSRSPLLGIFGVFFLLAGIGLGVYAWRMKK